MKALLYTADLLAFIFLIIVFGCNKELSFEKHIAAGTLKHAFGICFAQIVHGTLYNGVTPTADTTYVEVKINVTQSARLLFLQTSKMDFNLLTQVFLKSRGINIVKLKPIGTPLAHVPTNFTITFDPVFVLWLLMFTTVRS